MNAKLIPDDATSSVDPIRRWTLVKTIAALAVVLGVLLGTGGTVVGMTESFRVAAEGGQPAPVDSLAASIDSSLQLGMWLTPFVVFSIVLWFVARAKLQSLNRSPSFAIRDAE